MLFNSNTECSFVEPAQAHVHCVNARLDALYVSESTQEHHINAAILLGLESFTHCLSNLPISFDFIEPG